MATSKGTSDSPHIMTDTIAAVRALKQNCDQIISSSLDPIQFAIKLRSAAMITDGTYQSICDTTYNKSGKQERLCRILDELIESVSLKGVSCFEAVINVLEDIDVVYAPLAENLRKTHQKLVCSEEIVVMDHNPMSFQCHSMGIVSSGDSDWSQYGSFLRAMYSRRLDSHDQWPPVHTSEYIPVVFTKTSSIDTKLFIEKKARRILAGKVNDCDQLFADKVVSNCFTGSQKIAATILVEGAPGIGKTAFSYSICQKWASHYILQRFKAVIRWSLRDLIELDVLSISDLVMHDSPKVKEEIAKALCVESGNDVLFIFDGWDEIPENTKKDKVDFLLNLIKGKKLPKASHIVTTRSLQAKKSFKLKRSIFDYCYEITGFSESNIHEYIHKAFAHRPKDAQLLLKQLEVRPGIHSMCYVPIHCAIVVYVFLQKRKLPRTITEFYQIFIINSLLRNMQLRVEGGDEIDELASLNHLPKTVFTLFVKLAELAFRGLWTSKHSYSEDEVQFIVHSTTAKVDQLGVLQSQRIFHSQGTKLSFHFLHSSVQQFLAAYYLTSLKFEKQREYVDEYISYGSFYSVWQFYCGISTFKQLQQSKFLEVISMIFRDFIDFDLATLDEEEEFQHDDYSTLCLDTPKFNTEHTLNNEQEVAVSEDVPKFNTEHTLNNEQEVAVSDVPKFNTEHTLNNEQEVAVSEDVPKFNTEHTLNNEQEVAVSESVPVLEAPRLVMGDVSSVVSKSCVTFDRYCQQMFMLFLKCAYECKSNSLVDYMIGLCNHKLEFHGYPFAIVDMIPIGFLLRNVQQNDFQLTLENCRLQAKHLSILCHQVMQAKRPLLPITKVSFQNNKLRVKGAQELSKLLPIFKNCQVLNISSNDIGPDGLHYIAKALCHLVNLKELDLSANNIKCISQLCQAVCSLHHLAHINLSNNHLSLQESLLVDVFQSCHMLTHLSLADSDIDDDGVLMLVGGLSHAQSLKFLDLNNNCISEEGAAYLSTILGSTQIKELILHSNNIGIAGADLIFSSLSSSKVVQYLDVSQCGIVINETLQESLKTFLANSSLEKFDISCNPLGDEGLASLLSILTCNSCSIKDLNIARCNMHILATVSLGDTLLAQHSKLSHLTLSSTECNTIKLSKEFQYLLETLSLSSVLSDITFYISKEMRSDVKEFISEFITYIEELRSNVAIQMLKFHLVVHDAESSTYDESEEEWLSEEEIVQ